MRIHRSLEIPPMLLATLSLACATTSTPTEPPAGGGSGAPNVAARVAALRSPAQDLGPIRFGDPLEVAYDVPFFPGTQYVEGVTSPDTILGQPVGSRLARHAEVVACFEQWARESRRVQVATFGRTFEGRPLVRAVITSEANLERLDEILADLGRLADPRELTSAAAESIVSGSPAVAWMGYSIHGDEPSGTDAALALGYHLAAADSDEVRALLAEVVVVIDPCQNPDGRMRILRMIEESAGARGNFDPASMQRGRWPWGRGNHYLFDMNRDWLHGSQIESRARWAEVQRFRPQLFVDVHEMGPLDTFLFSPPREPINPHQPRSNLVWNRVFGADQAAAFDRYGWSYYTGEWAENWYPGYSDAWGGLQGAIGILHEQARTLGAALLRASGEVLTYRETVHHQAVGSLANLESLRTHREAILRSYLEEKRENVAADTPGNDRMFAMRLGRHPAREALLIETLLAQGVEVFAAREAFEVTGVVESLGGRAERAELPAGTIWIPSRQPASPLVNAFLELDPRFTHEELLLERAELEQKGETRIYDVTAWSLVHAFDLDGLWCDAVAPPSQPAGVASEERLPALVGTRDGAPAYGWVVDGLSDDAVTFAVRALEAGLAVHLSDKAFTTSGRTFARGSLLVRRAENPRDAQELVRAAANAAGVVAYATSTARSPNEGPDLGGGHFHLLERPRVAILSNSPVSTEGFGHLWFHLDQVLGVPVSQLDAQSFGEYDLRRFNVLVLPPGGGSIAAEYADTIAAWVQSGGTLIACGSAAGALAGPDSELSDVRLRRHVLEELDGYAFAAERELAARRIEIDEALVWGDAGEPSTSGEDAPSVAGAQSDGLADPEDAESETAADPDAEREDEWRRRFAPTGVFLRGHTNPNEWLTVGAPDELPVFFSGSRVYLAQPPVRTAVRLAEADSLRLAGLVWPEARERIERSAWATVEGWDNGQIILFASLPAYRGVMRATARFFSNAVIYGPGAGATSVLPSEPSRSARQRQ